MPTTPPRGTPTGKSVTTPPAPTVTGPAAAPTSDEVLHRLVAGIHHDPHSVLGPHPHDGGVTIRTLRPWATGVSLAVGDERVEMRHEATASGSACCRGHRSPTTGSR